MSSEDSDLFEFVAANPDHPIVKKANREYAAIVSKTRGGRGARLQASKTRGEVGLVFVDETGEARMALGIASLKKLEREYRSLTRGEPIAPSKYLVKYLFEREGEAEPAAKPERIPVVPDIESQPGRIRKIDIDGGLTMTAQPRLIDFTMARSFDPSSYTVDGRRFGEDWTRSLGGVRVAGRDAPVQLSMFPKKIAGFESAGFEFETKRTPISEGLLFFGHRSPPTDEEAIKAADLIFGMGGHIYKLVALAHSLDGWVDWTAETADRFHWPALDSDHRGRRNAFEYLEIARCLTVRIPKVKLPMPLVESVSNDRGSWCIRRPFVFDYAERKINLQSRPTGALFRNPKNKKDAAPLLYAVAEAILQSGAGVDTDNRIPVLVDSSDGTGWHDTLLLWGLCGRPVPNTRKERLNARRYINRKIEAIMDRQKDADETVLFDFKRRPGRACHAEFKVVATDLFREAHRRHRRFVGVGLDEKRGK